MPEHHRTMSQGSCARLVAIGLLLGGSAVSKSPPFGGWEYLGEANVDGLHDRDNIVVSGARGPFRAIQMRVENGPIRFDRVVVHFEDGDSNPIRIRRVIPEGGQSRIIELPGGRRVIRSLEFWYARALVTSRRPKVRLFGMR
jgi:hypothetical protein